jgi:D-alanyl-D-alanine carboxypeptidase
LRRPGIRFIASVVACRTGMSLTSTGTAVASAGPDRQEITRALDLMTATGAAGAQVRITADGRRITARSGVARLGEPRGVPVNGNSSANGGSPSTTPKTSPPTP